MDNHKQMPWHSQNITEVCQQLKSSDEGLSDAEASKRLRENGPNAVSYTHLCGSAYKTEDFEQSAQ